MVQASAAISPGSSGGGLFDRRGRLVGITTSFIKSAQGLSFAIPPEVIGAETRAAQYSYTRTFAMGVANAQAGNLAKATDLLREAVALQSDFCEGWIAVGRLELDHERAAAAFRRATSACSDRAEAWADLGEALSWQASGLEGQIMAGMALSTREVTREIRDLNTQAVAAFDNALRLDSDDVSALMGLGEALQALEDNERACHAYRQVLRLAPGHLKAMTNLCMSLGLTNAAIEQCSEVVRFAQLQPDSRDRAYALVQAWLHLGGILKANGDVGGAREAFAKFQTWQQIYQHVGPDPEIARRQASRKDGARAVLAVLESRLQR